MKTDVFFRSKEKDRYTENGCKFNFCLFLIISKSIHNLQLTINNLPV
jgi:hypothetical protein